MANRWPLPALRQANWIMPEADSSLTVDHRYPAFRISRSRCFVSSPAPAPPTVDIAPFHNPHEAGHASLLPTGGNSAWTTALAVLRGGLEAKFFRQHFQGGRHYLFGVLPELSVKIRIVVCIHP